MQARSQSSDLTPPFSRGRKLMTAGALAGRHVRELHGEDRAAQHDGNALELLPVTALRQRKHLVRHVERRVARTFLDKGSASFHRHSPLLVGA